MAWFDQIFGLSTVKSRAGLRVDRVDFDALQALVYRSLSQTIGAVLGEGAGCLTTPSFEVATSGVQWWVEVGACQIYYSHTGRRADGSPQVDALGRAKVIHGVILAHDPLAEGQGLLSRIEITDWLAAAAARFDYGTGAFSQDPWPVLPYLWARPVLVDVETGTRRVWSALTEAEEPVTGPTRTAARVEFRFATTAPAVAVDGLGIPQEPPWVKIAQIQSWALGTTFDLAGRSGPERPLVFPISAWDSDQWFRFTREAGTSGYEGRAESAGASDPGPYPATDPRFGLPPTSLITDGRLAAVYDDDQRAYVAAERAHTSGASAFLAPLPPWDAREGFAFPSSGRVQTADQPGGLGLIGLTHLLRDRFRAVQEGGLTLADDVNPRANSLDNTDVGTVPWWRRPRRGLAALDRALRALTDDTIPDLLAQLAAEVAARLSGDATVRALSRLRIGCMVRADYNAAADSYTYTRDGVLQSTPVPDLSGNPQWWANAERGICVASIVQPLRNTDDGLWGSAMNGYLPASGGYTARPLIGVPPRVEVSNTAAAYAIGADLGAEVGGARVHVRGGYLLLGLVLEV